MSWVSEYNYAWYEKFAINVIRAGGQLPQHVAFIMDGNRRYAQSEHLQKIEGHMAGFEKLSDCLRWCLDMGIREVTTFAFSIENFKRSDDEVNDLFQLASEKFSQLLNELPRLHSYGVRLRIIGNLDLLSNHLKSLIAKAMLATESNNKLFLNVAFSYTSRDEITQAIEMVLKQKSIGGHLSIDNIDEHLLGECLQSPASKCPDLLIRTSGESRISDFLMWQLTSTVLHFTNVLWPRITIWHFLAGIFHYQRTIRRLAPFKEQNNLKYIQWKNEVCIGDSKIVSFLQCLDKYRRNILVKLADW